MKTLLKFYPSVLLFFLSLSVASCSSPASPNGAANAEQPVQSADVTETPAAETPPPDVDEAFLNRLRTEKWSGDIDGMVERRYIRALVLYNKTNFFFDGPQPHDVTYEALKEFEKFLNKKLNTGEKPVNIVFIPVTRTEGLKRIADGRFDIAASNLPIVPELQKIGDFSD